MNRTSKCLSANSQLSRLRSLFDKSNGEFSFMELCRTEMGIEQEEAILFFKLLNAEVRYED